MYTINQLSKSYAKHKALNNVSVDIPSGQIFGLLGPNGAGKTTLLSILLGLMEKDSGSVLFKGQSLESCLAQARRLIGYVPQELAFYPTLSAHENLSFYAKAFGVHKNQVKAQIEFCVETTGLQKYYYKKTQTYSGGLKRRLNFAIGLLNKPQLLCLDEPTVGIDPQSRNFILETIQRLNQQGMTIIYTSHYMEEVQQICNVIAIIDHGNIIKQGTVNELLRDQQNSTLTIDFDRVLDDASLLALQKIAAITEHSEHYIKITTQDPLSVLCNMATILTPQKLNIARIQYGTKNLEELFLAITHKKLRDGGDE